MTDRVLVTGLSGFIGGHVALALLRAGFLVRGSLRHMNRAAEVAAMLARAGADVSQLEVAELDLLDDHGWRQAAEGCRFVMHVASPIVLHQPKHREDLIRPAVEGVRRAITAALEAGVERVVLTSSVAAVAYGHPAGDETPLTSADWSQLAGEGVNAYSESKTRAELEAWSLMEEAGRRDDLATINPAIVLGPLLTHDVAVSPVLVQRLLNGVPFLPRLTLHLVDVRDIAALHVAAMTQPEAGGKRFLASAPAADLIDVANALRAGFPEYAGRLPRLVVPDWMVRLYALVDTDTRDNLGALQRGRPFDTAPARALLGRDFITPRLSAAATAQSLIAFGLVQPPRGKKRD